MKRLLMFSLSIFLLTFSAALVFHMDSEPAEAQSGGMIVGFSGDNSAHYVVLSNGDVYRQRTFNQGAVDGNACDTAYGYATYCGAPDYIGNFWSGGVVATHNSTMGGVKSLYGK